MTDGPRPAGGRLGRSPGAPPRSLGRRLAGPQNNNLWFWVFVGPFVVGLARFVVVPIGWSVYLSLFEARNTVSPTEFVGLRNYRDMLADPAFRSSLWTFVAFAAFIVPITFACALGLALLVNRVARRARRSSARCSSCRWRAATSSPR